MRAAVCLTYQTVWAVSSDNVIPIAFASRWVLGWTSTSFPCTQRRTGGHPPKTSTMPKITSVHAHPIALSIGPCSSFGQWHPLKKSTIAREKVYPYAENFKKSPLYEEGNCHTLSTCQVSDHQTSWVRSGAGLVSDSGYIRGSARACHFYVLKCPH